MSDVLIFCIVLLCIVLLWGLPIWMGIRAARRRQRSALWMWFGLHPLGAWIGWAVLANLPPLKVCPQCAEKAKVQATVCPHCRTPFRGQDGPGAVS